ncbi:hypothetical protein QBC39DRAFT_32934 [Podospora conica]|nr:hypothetical protein QBC39DRAFT_32934 [Schizothecium conicum]
MRALLPLVVIATVCHSVAAIVDFSFYPQLAQNCLYQSSNSSKCDEGTVSATNNCLCTNGGSFITNTAKCLGREDPADVVPVYQTMKTACSDSKTPIKVTEAEFVKAAAVSSTTTAATTRASETPTVTQTVTSTASPAPGDKNKEDEEPSKGLSTGALAGIIGGAVAALAVVGGLIFFLIWRRRRRDGEESHPMLPQHGVGMHAALPPHAAQAGMPSPGMPSPGMPYHAGAANEWPDDRKWRPSPNPSDHRPSAGFSWETPYDPYATPKLATPPPPAPPPPAAYELVGSDSHLPAEVPGSPPIMEMDGTPVPQPQDRFRPYRG